MAKCKLDRTKKCGYSKCTPACDVFKKIKQQTLTGEQAVIIETKKGKGHTTVYFKVKKKK